MFRRTSKDVVDRFQRFLTGVYPPGLHGLQELLVLDGAAPEWVQCSTTELLVFVPRSLEKSVPEGLSVVLYEGALDPEGEELRLDGRFAIAAVGYTAAGFVPVNGPTLVRVACTEDFEDYLDDADAAQSGSGFRSHLLHPLAVIGDQCALGSSRVCPSSTGLRAVMTADGLAPSLFAASSSYEEPCLHGIVDDELAARERAQRPWLTRYLTVLEVLQRLPHRPSDIGVSGFGFRVVADEALPVEDATAPVVLRTGEGFVIADPTSGRVFAAPRDAAAVVELVSTHLAEQAVDAVRAGLDVSQADAHAAIEKVHAQLPSLALPRLGVPA